MIEIVISQHFKKQLKRYLKKDRKLLEKLKSLLLNFEKSCAISLGHGVYKTRVQGMGKGKSSGYRLYILIVEIDGLISPLCIYPKSDQENLSVHELTWHLNIVKTELKMMI